MARSSGARPKKAVKEEVEALKAYLGTIRSYDWVRAQVVFDKICELCEVSGKSGKMVPRSCKTCGYFGHTRQFCPEFKVPDDRGQLQRWLAQATPEQLAWADKVKSWNEQHDSRIAEAGGCKSGRIIRSASDIEYCACEGCEAYRDLWRAYESKADVSDGLRLDREQLLA